jgi:hypothetical protein
LLQEKVQSWLVLPELGLVRLSSLQRARMSELPELARNLGFKSALTSRYRSARLLLIY